MTMKSTTGFGSSGRSEDPDREVGARQTADYPSLPARSGEGQVASSSGRQGGETQTLHPT